MEVFPSAKLNPHSSNNFYSSPSPFSFTHTMKLRPTNRITAFAYYGARRNHLRQHRLYFTSFLRKIQPPQPLASVNGGGGGSSSSSSSQGNPYLVPGATVATIFMLGALHARRLYNDKKIEEAREKGIELDLQPDVKATFLRLLPLRSISRFWGALTSVDLPIWTRPYVYRAWARAFHSNLEEAAFPLDRYKSLREFFVRTLKEGSRPIDSDPCCLVSPVDGTVLRFGELKESGAMIEQVKGFSYSVSALIHGSSFLPVKALDDTQEESSGQENTAGGASRKTWWRISLASPKVSGPSVSRPMKGLFYCVIYLKPGDYHRIHSPVDWNVLVRRHFSGRLFPLNERATRTIKNLYVENERVVLEGKWQEGYMALAAIGATNIGSIEVVRLPFGPDFYHNLFTPSQNECPKKKFALDFFGHSFWDGGSINKLFIEPALRTNRPRKNLLQSEPPEERAYEPEGTGVMLKKGDEVAAFNMGSTVVLLFQAPASKIQNESSKFKFCVDKGDRIRMGEALGRWHDS